MVKYIIVFLFFSLSCKADLILSIKFEENSFDLSEESKTTIDKTFTLLKLKSKSLLYMKGTCTKFEYMENPTIAYQRLDSIKDYLLHKYYVYFDLTEVCYFNSNVETKQVDISFNSEDMK